jgi:hypothetical protein
VNKKSFHRIAFAVVAVAGMLVALTGCASKPKVVNMEVSWAEEYDSIGDLKAHADLAVVGTFSSIDDQTTLDSIPYTDFGLTIERVLYPKDGQSVKPGSVVLVHQTGGVVDKVTYQVDGDALFKIGEAVAVFLVEYQHGYYRVIGGPTGRFEVINGIVSPASADGARVTGDVDSFAAQVAAA